MSIIFAISQSIKTVEKRDDALAHQASCQFMNQPNKISFQQINSCQGWTTSIKNYATDSAYRDKMSKVTKLFIIFKCCFTTFY